MQTLRKLRGSLMLALFSAGLVIGGISLALAENYFLAVPTITPSQVLLPTLNSNTLPPSLTIQPIQPVITETTHPTLTSCTPPAAWIAIKVQSGDTLDSLAQQYQTNPDTLSQANCLFSSDLTPDSLLYVPPLPPFIPTLCGPPSGWVVYSVQAGNTLYSLGRAYGVTVAQLQQANCMLYSQTGLRTGQQLWVPNVITMPLISVTQAFTPISIIFPTLTGTATEMATPTATLPPTATPTASATLVPTTLPTATAISTSSTP